MSNHKMVKLPQPHSAQMPTAAQAPLLHSNHEEIARRAYDIYLAKGSPQGKSEQIWQQAEKELQWLSISPSLHVLAGRN